jgi:hypothetical protein
MPQLAHGIQTGRRCPHGMRRRNDWRPRVELSRAAHPSEGRSNRQFARPRLKPLIGVDLKAGSLRCSDFVTNAAVRDRVGFVSTEARVNETVGRSRTLGAGVRFVSLPLPPMVPNCLDENGVWVRLISVWARFQGTCVHLCTGQAKQNAVKRYQLHKPVVCTTIRGKRFPCSTKNDVAPSSIC